MPEHPQRLVRLLVLSFAGLICSPCFGAEIYLKDGSVVIGSIENLENGEDLTVDTEYMDEVVIEWDAVQRIEGTAPVNVEFFSGRRVTGNLRLGENGLMIDVDGVEERVLPSQVFEIEEYTAGWRDGFSAYVDLGLNVIRGNNQVSQVSYSGGIAYDANRFETGVDSTLIVNEQADFQDTRRLTLSTYYTHRLAGRWSAGARYSFEKDDQQELLGRSLLAGTINNTVLNSRVQRIRLLGGLAVNSEDFVGTPASESLEALLGMIYRLRSPWDFDLDATLYALPSITESGRYRIQFDSTASKDLIGDLDFRLTYYNRFDSDPPAAVENVDYGITMSLGYEF